MNPQSIGVGVLYRYKDDLQQGQRLLSHQDLGMLGEGSEVILKHGSGQPSVTAKGSSILDQGSSLSLAPIWIVEASI